MIWISYFLAVYILQDEKKYIEKFIFETTLLVQ
jgi:hypothetical protein